MKAQTVLKIDALSVSLTGTTNINAQLVRNVSLSVDRGQVTGLIGESGCGKSLTCLAIMNLLPESMQQSSGTIELAGIPVHSFRSLCCCYRGSKAALILQNPITCFDPIFTIAQHIRETLSAHGMQYRKRLTDIRATLHGLGFDEPDTILAAYPFQLSGGMLQRIMISLALLLEVELLIADEPTTDLDVIVQSKILDLLDVLRREKNIGILMVTHDLSVIARLADQVVVMQHGCIVETGPVAKIFKSPRHTYTTNLLDAHFSLYNLELVREEKYEVA